MIIVEVISHLARGGNRNFDRQSKKAAQIDILCRICAHRAAPLQTIHLGCHKTLAV